jgi:hypothetical protein
MSDICGHLSVLVLVLLGLGGADILDMDISPFRGMSCPVLSVRPQDRASGSPTVAMSD